MHCIAKYACICLAWHSTSLKDRASWIRSRFCCFVESICVLVTYYPCVGWGFILSECQDWKWDMPDYRICVAHDSSQSYSAWAALRNQPQFPHLGMQKCRHQKLEITYENVNLDNAMFFSELSETTGKTHFKHWKRNQTFTRSQKLLKGFAYHNQTSI